MSKEKFTPGPWIADLRGGCCAVYPKSRKQDSNGLSPSQDRIIHYSNRGSAFDHEYNCWNMDSEARANANLIAAAPDMYEALKEAREEIGRLRSLENLSFESPAMAKIDVALNKANGK